MAATKRKWNARRWLAILVILISGGAVTACSVMPGFGKLPDGERLARIQASPNYRDGEFRNQQPTTMMTGEDGQLGTTWKFLFGKHERRTPEQALPIVATDLAKLDPDTDVAVWLGHSSYYLQLGGKRILIDPVFSNYAAPFSFMNRAFKGDYPFTPDNMPEIDYLILSHDHWDHIDYPTLNALKTKVKTVITPLGVGSHLAYWGFDESRIHEADWNDTLKLSPDFTVYVLPARHFSGRGMISKNQTLWAGFLLETPQRKVFYSGDSGYGPHFAEIGQKFGGVDLAIMENGQYDKDWAQIHMMPEEAAQGAQDVQAKTMLPGHSGRFTISNHTWDDPYKRVAAASQDKPYQLLTPKMGEVVRIGDETQTFSRWWETAGP